MSRQLVSVVTVLAATVYVVLLSGMAAFALPLSEVSASLDSYLLKPQSVVSRGCPDPLSPDCGCAGSGC
ncbi:hypothetical protein PM082_023914 [Marasmius tenuissimus]|nr:hypothetical protein PM082_023914 [Marasmius tenuissimus]